MPRRGPPEARAAPPQAAFGPGGGRRAGGSGTRPRGFERRARSRAKGTRRWSPTARQTGPAAIPPPSGPPPRPRPRLPPVLAAGKTAWRASRSTGRRLPWSGRGWIPPATTGDVGRPHPARRRNGGAGCTPETPRQAPHGTRRG